MGSLPTDPAELKLSRAKAAMVVDLPFFATISMNSEWIRADEVVTMATDGDRIYWAYDFVMEHTLDELKFVVCHEVMHCVLEHMDRMGDRDPTRWNYATDYVINDMLITQGIGTMPEGGLHNPGLVKAGNGMAEQVYNLLPPDTGKGNQSGNGPAAAGPGGKGNARKPGPLDKLMKRKGTPAQQRQAQADMKLKVAQAAMAARMCGKLSAGLERFVGEILHPKVPWEQVLRDFVAVRAKIDRTWSRPSRRFLGQGMYLPSRGGSYIGEVLVAVDCSGSVSEEILRKFTGELTGIHSTMHPTKLHVFYFDSEISHVEEYEPDDTLDIRPHGGGGTAFSPIFRKSIELGIDPCCCVVLTDGYCSDYGPPPDYPVLWVTIGDTNFPWGQVIELKD